VFRNLVCKQLRRQAAQLLADKFTQRFEGAICSLCGASCVPTALLLYELTLPGPLMTHFLYRLRCDWTTEGIGKRDAGLGTSWVLPKFATSNKPQECHQIRASRETKLTESRNLRLWASGWHTFN
jgi:hypothetical protein